MPKIVFLHPDLGIGGAEKAVVDAALALKSRGHEVEFLTAHHDPNHCFQETRDGSFKVTVAGDWLPRNFFGRFYAVCAYIRMIYAAIYLVFFSDICFDIVFCDQISACVPILKCSKGKILFYCHFPDMLLAKRDTILKRIYRAPIDLLEEWTTGMAHIVLVNSKFTASVFQDTFRSLRNCKPSVLYPIPDFTAFNKPVEENIDDIMPTNKNLVFLSINRYERKKNLALAIQAFGQLKDKISKSTGDRIHLIMAGGYDERVVENKEHYLELRLLCDKLGINDDVTFLRSISDGQKRLLLEHCDCLIYTPDKEHFGIVPIEAMYMKCPVIACSSGGPLETVVDGKTGYLREGLPDQFAEAMERIVDDPKLAGKLGEAGKKHVEDKFSFRAFTQQLNTVITELMK
ncbi:alpha-1,3/1,6-mannosyltransferase ALG2-like isoform X1 [Ruditapes philippinarum]|uniref:alpha-1,3/1,6-mannosyltransferase ALG2-like isoform X1 n=2 Tax=Ruditapes philippinarum TaxID=129788 RepID=UPI00295ADBDA|nr:alpha-1,3/1,6-mannosyltransferase ALG2-like isoform X1 [Ruditapes philippinarum]